MEFVPDQFKTREMWERAVKRNIYALEYCRDQYKTQEMRERAAEIDPYVLRFVPDQYKTQEKYARAVERGFYPSRYGSEKRTYITLSFRDIQIWFSLEATLECLWDVPFGASFRRTLWNVYYNSFLQHLLVFPNWTFFECSEEIVFCTLIFWFLFTLLRNISTGIEKENAHVWKFEL